jgi:anthranilate synthase/phosphoribosyltransferase
VDLPFPLLDTCGTGGDGKGTFNISSFAALIAASCGAKVAKHGNRAVSSVSGSADFYKALGIDTELQAKEAANLIKESGFAFLFAPFYHKAMRHAASVRKELGVKTIMNLLGPLSNPASASYQLIGVFAAEYVKPVAKAAILLGLKRVLVVHGAGGIDEISVSGETYAVYADAEGNLEEMTIKPADFGIGTYPVESLAGGSAEENAALAKALLGQTPAPDPAPAPGNGSATGSRRTAGPAPDPDAGSHRAAASSPEPAPAPVPGAVAVEALREAVCMNAGAAVFIYGLASDLKEGYRIAKEALVSGETLAKTEEISRMAPRLKGADIERANDCGKSKPLKGRDEAGRLSEKSPEQKGKKAVRLKV